MRVLHITPWYPTPGMPENGIFIKRHTDAIGALTEQTILHIDLVFGRQQNESCREGKLIRISKNVKIVLWRWYEYKFYRLLKSELIKIDAANQFTHVVFHIAYPSLVYFEKLKVLLPHKKLITEHWSAYRLNFNSSKDLSRIAEIFNHGIPLTVVSKSLGESICKFSNLKLDFRVVPNVVHEDFSFKEGSPKSDYFFAAAWWKNPKKPMALIEAIAKLKAVGKSVELRIAGDGPLCEQMHLQVTCLGIDDRVLFLGRLTSTDLAKEMNRAKAFVMPTGYETFSVACAEALVCGCPVISNRVGAIAELVNNSNGILLEENESWELVLSSFDTTAFDRKKIANNFSHKFSSDKIASTFFEILNGL